MIERKKLDFQFDQAFEEYQFVIYSVVKNIPIPKGLNYDDLISFGYSGLYNAWQKYRPENKNFVTYACFTVYQTIKDEITKWKETSVPIEETAIF